jgi:hypothetical protein
MTYSGGSCTNFALTGVPPNQTLTCVSGGGVPVCTPTANPSAPARGTSTTISANCSDQPFPNGYLWTGGACAGRTTPTCTVSRNRTGTVVYSVKATNGAGAGARGQISVTWQ